MTTRALHNPLLKTPSRGFPKAIAVIGAGTIGPDISYYLMSTIPELSLVLVDLSEASLEQAKKRISGYVEKGLKRKKITQKQADGVTHNILYTLDYASISECDWVLEAATENVDLKRKIFKQVESIVSPQTLITSNTSSLPASLIFADLEYKHRSAITHFFAPAFSNPAVEVVGWKGGDDTFVDQLRWLFSATGKVPLVTADVLCFMLDRIFDNWCNEAGYLLDEGVTAEEVDSVASEFVFAGPFCVLNLANGNPIIIETNTFQAQEEGRHYLPAPIFRSVSKWKTLPPGETVDVKERDQALIRDRLLGVLFSQSVDIIDSGVASSNDLELGCRIALGFKKGPFELMEALGTTETNRILKQFSLDRPGMPLPKKPIDSYLDFYRHILVDDLEGCKIISIRRPDALNALHDQINDEILSVIQRFEKDPGVKGFILTGYGTRAFCAGADIGRFPSMLGNADEAAQYSRECSQLLRHIDGMAKPVVAAINGLALGGGFELAMRCHSLVALREAWFQLPEITLGIVPGIGAMVIPYRKWPHAAALFHRMVRNADKMSSEEAYKAGVVDHIADSYDALISSSIDRVEALTTQMKTISDHPVEIGEMPPVDPESASGQLLSKEVIAIMNEAISDAAQQTTLDEALEVGYLAFGASACTAAAREGISAFLERRRPDYSLTG